MKKKNRVKNKRVKNCLHKIQLTLFASLLLANNLGQIIKSELLAENNEGIKEMICKHLKFASGMVWDAKRVEGEMQLASGEYGIFFREIWDKKEL